MKTIIVILLVLATINTNSTATLTEIIKYKLHKTLDFIEERYNQFHFDGLLGVTFAHAFLIKSLELPINSHNELEINKLIDKCVTIHNKMYPLLPDDPEYMISFRNNLMNAMKWSSILPDHFVYGGIKYLGYYKNWTADTVTKFREARYKGIETDVCLREILELSRPQQLCYVSSICEEMMWDANRVDTGYLLTHKLLYMQIIKLRGCTLPEHQEIQTHISIYCSYIYKEAVTSDMLNFPHHDLFLEQIILCGMEGYAEFFKIKWLKSILEWQNSHGCYENVKHKIRRRTTFEVDFGCSDHTTGLAAANLALHLRYILYNTNMGSLYMDKRVIHI